MKRFIRNILVLIIAAVLLGSGFFIMQGYRTYQNTVSQLSVRDAVSSYSGCKDCAAFEDIDPDFVNAVVSVEDKRFFVRDGFDWIALIRAVIRNVQAKGAVEGGSTISQQIAKNLYYQRTERGLDEKLAEVFIMSDLEKIYSKEELFALYANMNYYGDGYWGISQAAHGYYNADCGDLSIAQAAMLAGIPNRPAVYQLSTGHDAAMTRQRWVLSCMLKNEYISEEEYALALEEDV